jgi:hypothetical protein
MVKGGNPMEREQAWWTTWKTRFAVCLITVLLGALLAGLLMQLTPPSVAGRTATPALGPTSTPITTAAQSAMQALPCASQTWIPLTGQSAAAVLAAVRQSPFFQMFTSAPPAGDCYTDLSHLDAPVLVLSYGATKEGGSVNAPDFYEIPVRSSGGQVDSVISAELNRTHTAIYVGILSGVAPTPTWPGHLVNASTAIQIVQVQRHTGLRPGTQAHLIFLAAFNTAAFEKGPNPLPPWTAGGGGPSAPIWLVPGADGHDYFVGMDAQSYTLAELPLV